MSGPAPIDPAVGGGPPAINLWDVHKWFGAVHANRGADLRVTRGEIHALVGENGAGKSTLMRIVSGTIAADHGHVEIDGEEITGWSTAQAIAAGLGMVHQHFMLVPTLTVAENIVLGQELAHGWQLDRRGAEREVAALSDRTGLHVDPARRVSELSVGQAQRVEILKALYRGARILILDEPTAVLSPPEILDLWAVLRRMRAAGETIVLITHKLDEVMDVSDSITVMRAGRTVTRLRTADTSPAEIARAMVGREVKLAGKGGRGTEGDEQKARDGRRGTEGEGPKASEGGDLLAVRGLRVLNARRQVAVSDLSFSVGAGEILGIAGVEGNGQTELVEALAGLRGAASGAIELAGVDVTTATVRRRGDLGLSHIPEDRQARGLILDYAVADNLILGQQHRFTRRGTLDRARIADNAAKQIEAFDIRPADPLAPARALSGGNQQKIVIAREMGRPFQVLLAAQPTRGVDVGAIEFIHAQLRAARDAGKATVLVSADLAEVLALSDRVAVMYGGRFAIVLSRADATTEILGAYMTGAVKEVAA